MELALNNIHRATDFLNAIDSLLEKDQGAKFRELEGIVMPTLGDAYEPKESKFRSHMGASLIGRGCDREIWYGFNWAKHVKHSGRMQRLFNRGHLEEGRFIALLLLVGATVVQQDENGNQYRISDAGGHFGGSGDGIACNIPGLPPQLWALTEFKTHGDKSFAKLVKEGVRYAKPEHFTQMQVYMHKMGLTIALYVAVNKNDDSLWAEFVHLESNVGNYYVERARRIIPLRVAPDKQFKTIGAFGCKFCDYKEICHLGERPDTNCRTCKFSEPIGSDSDTGAGVWVCHKHNKELDKNAQLTACNEYVELF